MPVFAVEIAETHLRIDRLVIKQIVDDVLKRFKDIPFREFRYVGDSEQLQTPGSAIDVGGFNRSNADNYVDVEIDDTADDEYGRSFSTTYDQNRALIRCTKTMLDMFPIYQNRKIVISMKIVCSSRVRLNGLIKKIKQAMHQSETLFTHQISYDYELPPVCTSLLNQIYYLMENQHGYGIEFIDWLREIKIPTVQMSSRLDGEYGVLCIRENANNVLSNLVEHEEEPRKQRDGDLGVWYIELDIELRYQRPNMIRCSYPPLVHNQFLPDIWFNSNNTHMYRDEQSSTSLGNQALEMFKWNLNFGVPGKGNLGIKEPYFDDWGKELHNKKLVTLLTSLAVVDLNDPQQFFNIKNDLSAYYFPEPILELISHVPQALAHEGKHFLNVKAYEGNDPIPAECLIIDSEHNIRLDRPMNPRGYYHVVISINVDPTTIASQVWEAVLCSGAGLALYFSYFGDRYKEIVDAANKAAQEGGVCLTTTVIDEVIREVIKDGNDTFDNPALFYDLYSRRTKLNYNVIGEMY